MTLGYFAPLPPSPTGVADYAKALLDALLDALGGALRPASGPAYEIRVNDPQADVALYQVGNNQLHREIYARALAHPGIVILHDGVLQHFFLGSLTHEEYIREFLYNYGEWNRDLAEDLWRSRAGSAADPRYFAYPMLKRIAECSKVVIVHNGAAARAVREHAPETRVVEIPHLFVPPSELLPDAPTTTDALALRRSWGVDDATLVAGVFGHLRETKRLHVILRALEPLWAAGEPIQLLLAGNIISSDLEKALEPYASNPHLIRTGYLSDRDFWTHAAAVDVCVNLRYPTAGETSGIAVRLMGIGKPVVFTDGEEISRIPETACLRVPVGPEEEATLRDYLVWLKSNPELREAIGRRAAAHIAEYHSAARVAASVWEVIDSCWVQGRGD
jgi:glycosyltransferase involved in cell wall biosynthesis